ncbi:MAG: M48 family metallopeptidase [Ignavibacteria bacterium]
MELFPPEIEIIRKRVKRLSLKVRAEDERIICTIPWFVTKADTLAFIEKNRPWIEKQKQKIRQLRSMHIHREKGSILYMGESYHVVTVPNATNPGIVNHEEKIIISSIDPEDALHRKEWYRLQAHEVLPPMIHESAKLHGFAFKKISIKHQKSKWGSCSIDGSLHFNAKMMLTPDYVIHYLIIHELAHTREFHHGDKFWQLVEECCPNYLEAEKYLRTTGRILEI